MSPTRYFHCEGGNAFGAPPLCIRWSIFPRLWGLCCPCANQGTWVQCQVLHSTSEPLKSATQSSSFFHVLPALALSERCHKHQYELYSSLLIYEIIKRQGCKTHFIILTSHVNIFFPFFFFLSLKINSLLLQSMLLRTATFDLHHAVEKEA